MDRVLHLSRQIVSAFSSSWTRTKTFADVQQQRGLLLKKLKGDMSTCWGLTSLMLNQIKEQLHAICIVLRNDRKASHLVPTWQDCDVIDSVIVILSSLEQLTDLLSGEKRVPCSVIKPLIKHIFENILSDKDITLTQEMKPTIKQDLQNRYSGKDISTFLDLCSFLDPCFKGQYSNQESEVSEKVYEEMKLVETLNDQLSKSADTEEPSPKRGKFSQNFG